MTSMDGKRLCGRFLINHLSSPKTQFVTDGGHSWDRHWLCVTLRSVHIRLSLKKKINIILSISRITSVNYSRISRWLVAGFYSHTVIYANRFFGTVRKYPVRWWWVKSDVLLIIFHAYILYVIDFPRRHGKITNRRHSTIAGLSTVDLPNNCLFL